MSDRRQIAILGSTGSIGTSALSVVDTHADRLQVAALAAANSIEPFVEQVARYRPRAISMATREALDAAVAALRARGVAVPPIAVWGVDGLVTLAEMDDVDVVLCASSGTAGLDATLAALRKGRRVALGRRRRPERLDAPLPEGALGVGVDIGKPVDHRALSLVDLPRIH